MTQTSSANATPGVTPKVAPETLTLKTPPRRVVRFKRNVLVGLAAGVSLAVLGVAWFALKGHDAPQAKSNDPALSTDHKPTPEGLSALPASYGQAPKSVPALGPPLPGDLGPPILERQRQLGADAKAGAGPHDEEAQAAAQRLAQQAQQIQAAGVFFQIGQAPASVGAVLGAAGQKAIPGEAASEATNTNGSPAPAPAAGASPGKLALDPDHDQNDQQHKLSFLGQSAQSTVNDHVLQTPTSPYTVMAGAVIAASLLTGLNSDLPGLVTAQVTENVYDTVTGRILLIPQGSRLIGAYDSVVAFGQSRALLAWQRIVLPNGDSIQIDNLPATDAAGYAGLKDKVDFHTWTLLKGIAMSTLIGVGGQVAFGNSSSNLVEAIRESTQESTNQAGQRIVEHDLNVQPTLIVRPGWPLRIVVHKDLTLRPYHN